MKKRRKAKEALQRALGRLKDEKKSLAGKEGRVVPVGVNPVEEVEEHEEVED